MRQLLMPLGRGPDYSAGAFLPTVGTAAARAALLSDFRVLGLYGGECSGKSHLLHVWAESHGVSVWGGDVPDVWDGGNLVVDNLEALTPEKQQQLFHLYNAHFAPGKESGRLLVASGRPIVALGLLPDLASRLLTGLQVEVLPPNDAEIRQLAVKWAADAGVALPEAVLDYMLPRLSRSAGDVLAFIRRLDALSLEQKKGLSVGMVRNLLEQGEGV